MKKILVVLCLFAFTGNIFCQQVDFDEYTLDNGLHVILHQDRSAPVITTAVMYHVGAKDETPDRTGFAHFFEHLLFEGTQNIARGEWFKIVSSNGGQNNANTSDDRTYYYEIFPSNNLQLGLWMESERMRHAIINQIGVSTQNEVVKEEKRLRFDNAPYGRILEAVKKNIFFKHPYRWTVIGEMEHLDAATLEEFQAFYKKFYIPNNAVLVVAGDFDTKQAKDWISTYFGTIPAGESISRGTFLEEPILEEKHVTFEDPNIQIPMLVAAYRTPSMKERDSRVLEMISAILSDGKTSRLYNKLVDKEKIALQIGAFNYSQEDYGVYFIYGLPISGKTTQDLLNGIDPEIIRIQTELISEREYEKLQNQFEKSYVDQNSTIDRVAHNLATYYLLYKDVNLINSEIDIYRSITREEIRDVARKYLNPNQRLILDYVPKK